MASSPRRRSAAPARLRRKPARDAERRRALELLAASGDGCTEAIMLAHMSSGSKSRGFGN
jgi:hypothetical protein